MRFHGFVSKSKDGWHSEKQKNTLAQHVLDIISDPRRVVRARSYETIKLIGTHCVRTYRVYSWGNVFLAMFDKNNLFKGRTKYFGAQKT